MQTFAIEIRDRNTCIPAVIICFTYDTPAEHPLFGRAGWRPSGCIVVRLTDAKAFCAPADWNDRTMYAACEHIAHEWREYVESFITGPARAHPFKSGQVIDVRAILGEAEAPAEAEWKADLQAFIDAAAHEGI